MNKSKQDIFFLIFKMIITFIGNSLGFSAKKALFMLIVAEKTYGKYHKVIGSWQLRTSFENFEEVGQKHLEQFGVYLSNSDEVFELC